MSLEITDDKRTKTLSETDRMSPEQGEVREEQNRVEHSTPELDFGDLSGASFAFSTDTHDVAIEGVAAAAARRRDAVRNEVRNHLPSGMDAEAVIAVTADRVDYTSRATEATRGKPGQSNSPEQNGEIAAEPLTQGNGVEQPNGLTNGNQEPLVLTDAEKAAHGYGIDHGNGVTLAEPLTNEIGIDQGEPLLVSETIKQDQFTADDISIGEQIRASYGVPLEQPVAAAETIDLDQPYASLVSTGMPDASAFTIDASQIEGLGIDTDVSNWLAIEEDREREGDLIGGLNAGQQNPDLTIDQPAELAISHEDRNDGYTVTPALAEEPIMAMTETNLQTTETVVDDGGWGDFTFSTDLRRVA